MSKGVPMSTGVTTDAEQDPRRVTILVVDDEDDNREAMRRILTRDGYVVLTAAGPADALALCQDGTRVDLLLSDVVMPHASGPELMERLSALRPGLRVLYVSG